MAWKRTKTAQAATGAPKVVALAGISGATEVLSPGDYSVPDPTEAWADFRDPDDSERRIQPGQILIETPLFIHNTSTDTVTVEVYLIKQGGGRVDQVRALIPARDTYIHNMPGQALRKTGLAKESGDRLFIFPQTDGVIDVSVGVSEGALEQNQPLSGSPSFVIETG